MAEILESGSLLLALLNPFLLVVYLVDLFKSLDHWQFRRVLVRAGVIAGATLCSFAVLGEYIFTRVIHAEFASFQIFGGIVFVLIGLQFMFRGPVAIEILRGQSVHVAGAVAMPVLIGPGTVSASVVVGKAHPPLTACVIVLSAIALSLIIVLLLKAVHDYVRPRNEALVERYVEIAGRVTALYVGTIAVEMIMQGVTSWLREN
ncbi:MAG: MarC family protein [Planctomycetota bacterium]|nr:MAG: MarC family protein [Planctomycetota bacterium]REJ90139.1 MAG: MarC family protein [Planctomycetota bacterium]REK30715.1 MAG: MarC family protein [Planctomycetota bacterium]REK33090.1 MAG: MarC family protein [Planctomycetota bacterium]